LFKKFTTTKAFRFFLLPLFFLSYVFLLLWAFQGSRLWIRFHTIGLLGFGTHPGMESFEEDLPVSEFHPDTLMVPEAGNTGLLTRPLFDTIEFHGHIFPDTPNDITAGMRENHIRLFIDLALRTSTADDYKTLIAKIQPSDRVRHFPGFNWKRIEEGGDYAHAMARDLEELAKLGIRGVKLWKNFGLMVRKPDGSLLKMDDPVLDPVWDVCAKYHLIIAMHTADPPAFWLPINGKNERFPELVRRPEWSFSNPQFPSFDTVMAQRDRLFAHRRDVRFVALHFGEAGNNLTAARNLLRKNPNVYLDTAQRIDELGRQPQAARAFFLEFQDRILYGTDGPPDFEKTRIYWRFFETDDEYFDYYPSHKPPKGFWKIYGIHLPREVLRKLYYGNAAGLLGLHL